MSAHQQKDLKDLPEKDMQSREAEGVKGGIGPIDSKKPPIGVPKPAGPIDA